MSPDFHVLDLVTDLLAGGESGRLQNKLVREKKLFSDINAYITSDIDPGLIILQGNLMKNVSYDTAEEAISEVLEKLKNGDGELDRELEKVKNKYESTSVFSNTSILNKAMNLSFYELLGNPNLINTEVEEYRKITCDMATDVTRKYFASSNCSTLYYKSSRKKR
jgi:predicted Zn-dependent peptidase